MFTITLCAGALLAFAPSALADDPCANASTTFKGIGGDGTTWSDNDNWDNGAPGPGAYACIDPGVGPVTLDVDASLADFEIDSPLTIPVGRELTTDVLTLKGDDADLVNEGTLNVTTAGVIDGAGATLSGGGDVTITPTGLGDEFLVASGTLNLTGDLTLDGFGIRFQDGSSFAGSPQVGAPPGQTALIALGADTFDVTGAITFPAAISVQFTGANTLSTPVTAASALTIDAPLTVDSRLGVAADVTGAGSIVLGATGKLIYEGAASDEVTPPVTAIAGSEIGVTGGAFEVTDLTSDTATSPGPGTFSASGNGALKLPGTGYTTVGTGTVVRVSGSSIVRDSTGTDIESTLTTIGSGGEWRQIGGNLGLAHALHVDGGTLTLEGANDVSGGTVQIDGATAVLRGEGTFRKAVTIDAGVIRPYSSSGGGALSFDETLDVAAPVDFEADVVGNQWYDADRLVAAGNTTFAGEIKLNAAGYFAGGSWTPALGDEGWTVVQSDPGSLDATGYTLTGGHSAGALMFRSSVGPVNPTLTGIKLRVSEDVVPTAVTALTSTSHAVGVPDSGAQLDLTWTAATDVDTAVHGYSYVVDHVAGTTPDASEEIGTATSLSLTPGDGTWYVHIRAVDNEGNAGPTVHAGPFVIDTVAPGAPSITGGPSGTTNAPATFTFTGEAGATFQCRIGTDSFAGCTSPATFTVADGARTFDVRQIDAAGNVGSSAATRSWTRDTVAPAAPTISPFAADPTNQPNVSVAFSGEGGATFACRIDLDPYGPCGASPRLFLAVADGLHTFSVVATDPAGNQSAAGTRTLTVDTTAPTVAIDSGPTGPGGASVAVLAFSTEAGATTECRVDGAAFAACTSPFTTAALADGAHAFEVRATDAAGNVGAATSRSWAVDTTAPAVTIDSAPTTGTATGATVTFSSEAGATFACALDAAAFTACTSPLALTGLAVGDHTVAVRATDAVGNVGLPATAAWRVDASPTTTPPKDSTKPTVTIKAPTCTGKKTARACTVSGTAADAGGVAKVELSAYRKLTGTSCLSWTGTAWKTVTCAKAQATWVVVSKRAGAWTRKLPKVATGALVVRARSTDAAGNVSKVAARNARA